MNEEKVISLGKKRFSQRVADYFEFAKHKTDYRTEILAGASTFMALAYIFVVNPLSLLKEDSTKVQCYLLPL